MVNCAYPAFLYPFWSCSLTHLIIHFMHTLRTIHFPYEISIDGSTCLIECYDDPLLIIIIVHNTVLLHSAWRLAFDDVRDACMSLVKESRNVELCRNSWL